ncbi:MAG: hypothetical protein ACJ72Z_14595 [Pyrinomonadaceae bacterium]
MPDREAEREAVPRDLAVPVELRFVRLAAEPDDPVDRVVLEEEVERELEPEVFPREFAPFDLLFAVELELLLLEPVLDDFALLPVFARLVEPVDPDLAEEVDLRVPLDDFGFDAVDLLLPDREPPLDEADLPFPDRELLLEDPDRLLADDVFDEDDLPDEVRPLLVLERPVDFPAVSAIADCTTVAAPSTAPIAAPATILPAASAAFESIPLLERRFDDLLLELLFFVFVVAI